GDGALDTEFAVVAGEGEVASGAAEGDSVFLDGESDEGADVVMGGGAELAKGGVERPRLFGEFLDEGIAGEADLFDGGDGDQTPAGVGEILGKVDGVVHFGF